MFDSRNSSTNNSIEQDAKRFGYEPNYTVYLHHII